MKDMLMKLKEVDTTPVEQFIAERVSDEEFARGRIGFIAQRFAISYGAYLLSDAEDGEVTDLAKMLSDQEVNTDIRQVILNNLEVVTEVKEKFTKDELLASLMFGKFDFDPIVGEFQTPQSISDLAIRMLDIKESEKVLDLTCGLGGFLLEACLNQPSAKYSGIDIASDCIATTELRAKVMEMDFDLKQDDSLKMVDASLYDKVFSNHPFAMNVNESEFIENALNVLNVDRKVTTLRQSDWLFNLSILHRLKEGGKAVSIMPGGALITTDWFNESARKYFVDNGYLEAVIALPSAMFEITRIPTYMLVFSKGNTSLTMVDATGFGKKTARRTVTFTDEDITSIISLVGSDSDVSKVVSNEKVMGQNYLLDPLKYMEELPEFKDGIVLEDLLLSVQRGDQLKPNEIKEMKTKEKTNIRCLELADIQDGYIDFEDEYLKSVPDGREKYLVKNNMVVLTRAASPEIRSAIIELEENQKIYVTGQFLVLEFDENKVNPAYMQSFFASEVGKSCLAFISSGASLKVLSLGQLKKLVVPIPSREVQDEIADEYLETLHEALRLKKEFESKKNLLGKVYKY